LGRAGRALRGPVWGSAAAPHGSALPEAAALPHRGRAGRGQQVPGVPEAARRRGEGGYPALPPRLPPRLHHALAAEDEQLAGVSPRAAHRQRGVRALQGAQEASEGEGEPAGDATRLHVLLKMYLKNIYANNYSFSLAYLCS